MLDALLTVTGRVIITRAKNARAADLESIAQSVAGRPPPVEIASDVAHAIQRASAAGGPVVVTGSVFVVAEAREAWLEHIGAPLPDRDEIP